ncbi:hypothetical protein HNY73_008980 [Argiope bruennichi]|uniref:Uncharacterized protein n=1 Tax=Argiope bruennichi TaxID=94029 RepID=A0A8T0FAU3_ARGBR|nr:hypothetical protein HNY73_008980 [Argiope bruennichi]
MVERFGGHGHSGNNKRGEGEKAREGRGGPQSNSREATSSQRKEEVFHNKALNPTKGIEGDLNPGSLVDMGMVVVMELFINKQLQYSLACVH